MPHQRTAGLEDARPFRDNAGVVTREQEEAERCEQVQNGVEPASPPPRQSAYVTPGVAELRARAAFPRPREKLAGQVQSVDVITGFREQVCVATLAAWHVENTRSSR